MNVALKAKHRFTAWQGREGLSKLTRLAVKLTNLVLIALIAWFLADTILTLTTPDHTPQLAPSMERTPELDADTLADAGRLFGTWDATATSAEVLDNNELVETNLPLNLIGVFVSDLPEQSGAIIATGNGVGTHYLVGDRIPGAAVLESVEASGVMLRRGARLERLSFPQGESGDTLLIQSSRSATTSAAAARRRDTTQQASALAATSASSSMNVSNLGEKIEEYRALATNNPQEALSQLGLQPVNPSENLGYRVGELPDNQWVRQTGLQEGDIVLSVNGRRIGDPDLDRLEIENFSAEGQVRLEIQRGERRFFVSTKLSP